METPPSLTGASASHEQGDEKISIKAENAAPQADEAMPDVPVERRLPPKKMKFLEERNGGAHSTGSPAEIKNESMKRSREEDSSELKSLEESRSSARQPLSDDEGGPRIRVRASSKKASFEGHFMEDSDDEQERARLQQIFEQDQLAAVEAGMDIEKMSQMERSHLPVSSRRPNRYLEIRNHILKLWAANKKEYLSKEAAVRALQKKYTKEAGEIHAYLARFGFINVGCLSNRPTIEAKQSVIVIGAGMAGIAAAYHLQSLGYRVRVLEGRDRLGGRCNTSWSGSQGMGVDMGAMVVTGKEGNPVVVMAEQLGIKMHALGSKCPIFDSQGKLVPQDIDQTVEKQFNEILTEASKCPREMFTSLGKALDSFVEKAKPAELELSLFNWHAANLEYGCAAELCLVDLHHWDQDDQFELGGGHYLLPTGYGSIVKGLAKNLDVKLNHVVQKVSYTAEGVDVACENGENFHADFAICSLPLGILKTEKIVFDPPLPDDKLASIRRLGFGLLNKLALYFERSFWSADEDYFGITSKDPERRGENFLFWNMQRTTGMPVLLALIAGKAAKFVEKERDEDVVARSLTALKSVYGELPPLERFQLTRWETDPFSCGSYSYIAEGATGDDYDNLARPLNRLHFAGEATCREHPATVVGACLSGLREAGLIDRACRGPIQDGSPDDDPTAVTPENRRRRIRTSSANVPSFRKKEGEAVSVAVPAAAEASVTFVLPSTEIEVQPHIAVPQVDLEELRRTIQASRPQPPPPAVPPPVAMEPQIVQPFRGSGYAPFNTPLPGAAHAHLHQQPTPDMMVLDASAGGSSTKKFREQLADLVIKRLHKRYMTTGRIASKEDFKHLARKLTHVITEKEQRKQNLAEPILTEEVRKKAKRYIDDFFSKLDVPYHSDKTGPLQLPDPLLKQREERKKAKKDKHAHGHNNNHNNHHKHHKQHHHRHHRHHHQPKQHAQDAVAAAEPTAPPMSPIDDAPLASLPPVALPVGFVPMAITDPSAPAEPGTNY